MSWVSRWRGRPDRARRADPEAELDRELAAWVAELASRHEAHGVPREEARRLALIETEGVEQVKEHVRDARRFSPGLLAERFRADAGSAFRALRATPVATGAAVVTLALAVGVNLAMFGLIDRALLSPPAHVTAPGQVFTMALHGTGEHAGAIRTGASFPTFVAIRDLVPALAGAAAFQRASTTAIIEGDQRQVNELVVSDEYFDLLGVRPALGSGIVRGAGMDSSRCFVSHAFWQAAFGGELSALGRHISIGRLDFVVAGVMPPGFSGHTSQAVDLWVTFAGAMRQSPGWDRDVHASLATILVRLRPTATDAAVKAQALATIQENVSLRAIAGAGVGATESRVAWWLAGVSILVLIVGLANVGILLVVRAVKRRGDVAIQTALGATRGRLLSQICIEAGLLALAATAVSLLAASWLDESIRRVLFPGVVAQVGLTAGAAWAAVFAGVIAAGVAAAASLSQLPSDARALAARRRSSARSRTIKVLLVTQTSLSVMLLAGAGVFGRSLHNLVSQDFGMTMDGVVVVQFDGPSERGGFELAVESIRALPGVELVTPIAGVPFGGRHVPPISVPGRSEPPSVDRQLPFLNAATPEFLQILRIRLIDGRSFMPSDDRGAPVVIVNETMARQVWPGERAVGKCIRIGFDPDFDPELSSGPPRPSARVPCREIIGVARDIRQRSLLPTGNEARLMQYFVPFSQVPYPPFLPPGPKSSGLLLRTSADLDVLAPLIRRIIVGDSTDLPFVRVAPFAQLLEPQLRPWRMATTVLVLFSALAVGVAIVGLHAAFAHAVAERKQEMAIRAALGAEPARVRRMVLREALFIAASGVIVGGAAAALAGRSVRALLFETAPSDPIVLGFVGGLMLVVALGATWIPALTASRADPSSLLKGL
jgi:predicted permease